MVRRERELLERITVNPQIMVGKPTIRGTRLTVEAILKMLVAGVPEAEILAEYQPILEPEDIRAVLAYSHHLLEEEYRRTREKSA